MVLLGLPWLKKVNPMDMHVRFPSQIRSFGAIELTPPVSGRCSWRSSGSTWDSGRKRPSTARKPWNSSRSAVKVGMDRLDGPPFLFGEKNGA